MQLIRFTGFWGALLVTIVTSYNSYGQTYSSVPYSDNFNSGLGTEWTTSSTEPQGVVEARNESGGWPQFGTTTDPFGNGTGGNGLAFYNSSSTATEDTLSALLHLNLAGATSVEMKFSVVDYGTGCAGSLDKLFVKLSNDGGATYGSIATTVFLNLAPHNDGFWNNTTVDIDAIATANSMSYSSTSVIKFSTNLKCSGGWSCYLY